MLALFSTIKIIGDVHLHSPKNRILLWVGKKKKKMTGKVPVRKESGKIGSDPNTSFIRIYYHLHWTWTGHGHLRLLWIQIAIKSVLSLRLHATLKHVLRIHSTSLPTLD